MDKELERMLVEKYPKLFKQYGKSPKYSCMAWGCEIGNGWYEVFSEMCEKLSEYDVELAQVKEKFGTLTVYIDNMEDDIARAKMAYDIVDEAESKSAKICEDCGDPGTMRTNGWRTVICDSCNIRRKRRVE